MGRKCSVAGCRSNYLSEVKKNRQSQPIVVYSFPKDRSQCNRWLACLPNQIDPKRITDNFGVCAKHFAIDVPMVQRGRHLVPGAPPTLFNNGHQSSSDVTKQPCDRKAMNIDKANSMDVGRPAYIHSEHDVDWLPTLHMGQDAPARKGSKKRRAEPAIPSPDLHRAGGQPENSCYSPAKARTLELLSQNVERERGQEPTGLVHPRLDPEDDEETLSGESKLEAEGGEDSYTQGEEQTELCDIKLEHEEDDDSCEQGGEETAVYDIKLEQEEDDESEEQEAELCDIKQEPEEEDEEDFLARRPKNIMTLHISDNDDLLYCEKCDTDYSGDCPLHGPLYHIQDSQVSPAVIMGEDPEYCIETLPHGLAIIKSTVHNPGLSVIATKFFPARSRFGPYDGQKVYSATKRLQSRHGFTVMCSGKVLHFVDASNPRKSNWMRYIKCARSEEEHCVTAYQHQGEIYYRAHKDIHPGTEILVNTKDWFTTNQ